MNVEELLENFALFEDWEDRYQYLIELGKNLPPMPEDYKTPAHKVEGCTAQVWMVFIPTEDGKFDFLADSDAHIVRGLIAILHILYAGKTAAETKGYDIEDIFTRLGLQQHLSVNRRNGFYAMVGRLQQALAAHG
ncbi:MAG: SufE family protein [Pseudomonadota bacterium]|nr:SufE family protein [Pseudomonadota bacterium]QKK05343.1 MAG: SufE family protein [Pseudomonadota bacterium]